MNDTHNALSVYDCNKKSTWKTGDLFTKWSKNEFVPSINIFFKSKNLLRKSILITDSVSIYPSNLRNGDIVVIVLPSNVTSSVQLLDQGVMEGFK